MREVRFNAIEYETIIYFNFSHIKIEMGNLTTKIQKRMAVCGLVNADLISIYRCLT